MPGNKKMNEKIIFNEILNESSVDTKYKPMEEVDNTDLYAVIISIILTILVIFIK